MLQLELLQDAVHHLGCQHEFRRGERRVVPRNNHLHDFSAGEAVSLLSNSLDYIVTDALHPDQFLAREDTARVPIQEVKFLPLSLGRLAILYEVVVEHRLALVRGWLMEVDNLVDTIMHGRVELIGSVCGEDNDHFVRRGAGSIQERVDGVAHVLGHLKVAAIAQEGIRLINEQNHAIGLVLSPVKELVELSNGVLAQRCDIRADHNRVFEAALHSKLLGEEGLSRAWRSVEHDVLTRRKVLSSIEHCVRDLTDLLLEPLFEDDSLQEILFAAFHAHQDSLLHPHEG